MTYTRLIRPYIRYEEVEAEFRAIFDTGIFTRGEQVRCFAEELARYAGARHAFLTTSATTALATCLDLLRIEPGDEVVVSDFSFPATSNVVVNIGATPVFADVSTDTFNMLPAELERKLSPKTRAVIFVDALGNPSGLLDILEICRSRRIPLIEDAACALGSAERGLKCGAIADLTCFSFHPRKLLTTGEGGAILCNRDDWADALTIKLNHGGHPHGKRWQFVDSGFNYRMSELQAAMGRVQLRKLDAIIRHRQTLRDEYARLLEPHGFIPQLAFGDCSHNVQSLVFKVPEGVNRDELIDRLALKGVESTLGTYCLSATAFQSVRGAPTQPNAKWLEDRTIALPLHDEVDCATICQKIVQSIKERTPSNVS